MRVTLRVERDHQGVFDDEDFQFVVEQATSNKDLLHFLGSVISRYESREEILHGKPGEGQNMAAYANSFLRDRRARAAGVKLSHCLEALYGRFDARHVRGCLIEAMVEGRLRLRGRYADPSAQLANNVHVEITNGTHYESSTSIDVVGHDGRRGECHDCKARGRYVRTSLVKELVANLVPRGFLIGVATAESAPTASRAIAANGFPIPPSVTVTGPESWWEGIPLWKT
jgi:hypothetical protein